MSILFFFFSNITKVKNKNLMACSYASIQKVLDSVRLPEVFVLYL